MRRNLIAGCALAAAAAATIGATTVSGSDSTSAAKPSYTHVAVTAHRQAAPLARAAKAAKPAKPTVVYLGGSGTVNTAETGPYIDFGLQAKQRLCPRVVDGGIRSTNNLDFFQQGSYVEKGRYHVLMALDDGAQASQDPAIKTPTIQYTLNLICLKGTR
jgi:hypothetical protein